MIHVRSCGHSEDTNSLRYKRRPERCHYCWYVTQHAAEYALARASGLQRLARLRNQALEHGLGTKIQNRPLESKARP
jgi:hypothetical protein